jgi:RND family efflux transporter MFP subunit
MKDGVSMDLSEMEKSLSPKPPVRRRWLRGIVKVLLPLLVLAAGLAGASYIRSTGPKPRKKQPEQVTPLVQVMEVHRSRESVVVEAMGAVIPAREIVLKPRISGEIISVHPEFVEGGLLKTGDEILRIDPRDYELELAQQKSQVTSANYALKLELGHQDVAKREWQLLNGGKKAEPLDRELALRKPHLRKAKADVEAAKADLEKAQLNLDRTIILSPFNSIIRVRNVELGSQASSQESLAELVGTDEYWIRASVPVDRLKWITIPRKTGEPGSPARIIYGNGSYEREGSVIRLLGDLESEGRMARIIVAVKDPLNLDVGETKTPPLLMGEYVRVEIQGQKLVDVFRIPRIALRDDAYVWIAGEDDRLSVRRVETLWRDAESVLLRAGLEDGERLIISDLPTPVKGMKVAIGASQSKSMADNMTGPGNSFKKTVSKTLPSS